MADFCSLRSIPFQRLNSAAATAAAAVAAAAASAEAAAVVRCRSTLSNPSLKRLELIP